MVKNIHRVRSVILFKQIASDKRKLLVAILLFVLILGITAIVLAKNQQETTKNTLPNEAKIKALTLSHDCSIQSQHTLANEKPSAEYPAASEMLLRYRISCLVVDGKYQQANTVAHELRQLYAETNNTDGLKWVMQQIDDNNYAIAHPVKAVEAKPEISSDEYKTLVKEGIVND
jgi:hypothetical protein